MFTPECAFVVGVLAPAAVRGNTLPAVVDITDPQIRDASIGADGVGPVRNASGRRQSSNRGRHCWSAPCAALGGHPSDDLTKMRCCTVHLVNKRKPAVSTSRVKTSKDVEGRFLDRDEAYGCAGWLFVPMQIALGDGACWNGRPCHGAD